MRPESGESTVAFVALARLTHASTVRFCKRSCSGLPTEMPLELPSDDNACPTRPAAKVTLPCTVPLLARPMSFAFPSPGYQATRPAGCAVQELCACVATGTKYEPR